MKGEEMKTQVTFEGGEFGVFEALVIPGEKSAGGVIAPWFTYEEMLRIAADWRRVGVDDVYLRVEEDAEGWRTVATCNGGSHGGVFLDCVCDVDTLTDLPMQEVDGETYYAMHGYAWVEVSDKSGGAV